MSEYCFTSLSAQSLQFRDRRKPEVGTLPYSFQMTSRVLYSAQYHRRHCTLHALEQFGALYMHSPDGKYSTWPGFETSTSEFRATNGSNESSSTTQQTWGMGPMCPTLANASWTQQTWDVVSMLLWCWFTVCDVGQALAWTRQTRGIHPMLFGQHRRRWVNNETTSRWISRACWEATSIHNFKSLISLDLYLI